MAREHKFDTKVQDLASKLNCLVVQNGEFDSAKAKIEQIQFVINGPESILNILL